MSNLSHKPTLEEVKQRLMDENYLSCTVSFPASPTVNLTKAEIDRNILDCITAILDGKTKPSTFDDSHLVTEELVK